MDVTLLSADLDRELRNRDLRVRVIFDWKKKNRSMNARFFEDVGPAGLPPRVRERYHETLIRLDWEYSPGMDHYSRETSQDALDELDRHFDVYVFNRYRGYVQLAECEEYVSRIIEKVLEYNSLG
ncbi:MAG: hypothetical protein ACE5KH_06180 [Candidatus Geothermarchaeales archaeon]